MHHDPAALTNNGTAGWVSPAFIALLLGLVRNRRPGDRRVVLGLVQFSLEPAVDPDEALGDADRQVGQ